MSTPEEGSGMTISEVDHSVSSLAGAAQQHKVVHLEAVRDRCVQQLLEARQRCEEANALHTGDGSGRVGAVYTDQDHAQWLLCAAVKDIEDVDALLEQAREP